MPETLRWSGRDGTGNVVTRDILIPLSSDAATPGLFFKQGTVTPLVGAHYFGPYPRSMDNATTVDNTYYRRHLLRKAGESSTTYPNGKFADSCGYLRDMPIYRNPLVGDYKLADCGFDVDLARKYGIGLFFANVMTASGPNWENYLDLMTAADTRPGFQVSAMIDTNGGGVIASTPTVMAEALAPFFNRPCTARQSDGSVMVSAFKMEGKPVDWWGSLKTEIKRLYGVEVFLVGTFNSISLATNYKTVADAVGPWSYGADPTQANAINTDAATARSNGMEWLSCVLPGNVRPAQAKHDESRGLEALVESYSRARREKPSVVQIVTWSDFSEGSQITFTSQHGYSWLEVSAYHAEWLRSGVQPAILRPVMYLSHRKHKFGVTTFGYGQTKLSVQFARGSRTAMADVVEVRIYLPAAARAKVLVGSTVHEWDAPAGESSKLLPLGVGVISGQLTQGSTTLASVQSPVVVTATPDYQDFNYWTVSSLSGTAAQEASPQPLVRL